MADAATAAAMDGPIRRLRVRITGAVQGVGFRPFVRALARRYRLGGFVLNDQEGVLAEIEGSAVEPFLGALWREAPPLARIQAVQLTGMPARGERAFAIRRSDCAGPGRTPMIPDAATCAACLAELFDPTSRFYLYPFVTCTHCGPRFTITRRLPYDRPNTTMSGFGLCAACAADYGDPAGRRSHAETIACPACGPRLSHSPEEAADVLRGGGILALKGIGGFHLLCDARNEAAVANLRRRKQRPRRPVAVMAANLASIDGFASATAADRRLLAQVARPIVLVRAGEGLAPSVAPGLSRLGVMLPSSPVHYLILHELAGRPTGAAWLETAHPLALVVTSANLAGAPLIIDNAEAADLAILADLIVTHDRSILARADDSVMAVIDGAPAFIRRSRGFAPEPIDLGEDGPAVLAVGGHLKATVCVTRGREAFLSAHVGDLGSAPTVRAYEETARRMMTLLDVAPELVACDLHPDYHSTRFAESLGRQLLRVQHHAAHLAAVAAEHQLIAGPLIGVALDGHGHGEDGGAWGGELMRREGARWRRIGHLQPLAMPGGDRAAREPWRMGVAVLSALGLAHEAAGRFSNVAPASQVAAMLSGDRRAPTTTSLGRLFDAAAALLGVCAVQTYEGQAAMELEALVDAPETLAEGFVIDGGVLDFRPLMTALLAPGLGPAHGAALFHGTLVAGLAEWICRAADAPTTGRSGGTGAARDVVLGGGCLMNRVLAEGLANALWARGLTPRLARLAPANDGGLSLGQAALARAHLAAGRPAATPLRT
jgi:hydrogenase maturation protein HypF